MASDSLKRLEITHFEGTNAFVASHVGKSVEFKHVENARSASIGTVEKRNGTISIGDNLTELACYGLFYFENDHANTNNLYRTVNQGGTSGTYYYNTSTSQWTSIRTGLANVNMDFTIAEGNMFMVNGSDNNSFVQSNGTTVVEGTTASITNHLYKAPKARKVNYYKDRLYLADYNYGSERVKNGIAISSTPMGLICLADGDSAAGETEIPVTDTTYIWGGPPNDSLDVYRGGSKIGTIAVTGKTESQITIIAASFDIESADELWVAGTYGDFPKVFRWPDTLGGKTQYEKKSYDTFKLTGEQNGEMTMMANVGDVMVYANRENIGRWNNHYAKSLDLGIGCASDFGYVKALGTLWFLDYNGIYATTGGYPKLMSSKVEPYITGATKEGIENAAAGRKGFSIFWSIGDVTLYNKDGSPKRKLENVVLEYNLRQENWYVHTRINAVQFATYKDTNNSELLAYNDGGDAGRNCYEFLNKDRYMDANPGGDRAIQFRVDTIAITLSKQFEKINYPQEIIIETLRGSVIETFISLDHDQYYRVTGDSSKGCTIVKTDSRDKNIEEPRCRQISVSLRDSTEKPCVLSRMAMTYVETLEEQNVNEENIRSLNA